MILPVRYGFGITALMLGWSPFLNALPAMPNNPNSQSRSKKDKLDYPEVAAAYLTYKGYTQIQVAKRLKISQSKVSRLIEKAKETHHILVDSKLEFVRTSIPDELLVNLENEFETDKDLEKGLRACSSFFKTLKVVGGTDFIEGAAALLPNLLKDAKVLGVSWGRTCSSLIESLNSEAKLEKLEACIPIQGEPAFWNNVKTGDYSATRLAYYLEQKLMKAPGKERYPYSLAGVPAYVSPAKKQVVREFYCEIPGFRAVFGSDNATRLGGKVIDLNGVITGVGVPFPDDDSRTGVFIKERIAQGSTSIEEISKLCFGDFSGILLPKRMDDEKVKSLNLGWTGLQDGEIKGIAKMKPDSNPGTILVAEGSYKANVVLAAVRADFVTRLIVDKELADSLRVLL